MRRVLVTGASGFVGRALSAHLAMRGFAVRAASRVLVPARAGIEPARLPDLADGSVDWRPLLAGVDAVVHAAAIAHTRGVDAARHDAINHRAVARLAQMARGRVERLVFLSSIRAQSGGAAPGVLTEVAPPSPTDAYGLAKLAAEEALARSGTPAVILRPVLVAGEGAAGNLQNMARFARLPVPLPFGALTARRSVIGLADLCAAIAHVLGDTAHLGCTYIVAHPEPIAVADMFAALRTGMGRAPGLVNLPRPLLRLALAASGMGGASDRLFGDLMASPAKLMATGWTPRVTPAEALAGMGAVGSH